MRQVHIAGDKVFVDYSGKKLPIVDRKTGEIREVEIFVGVLGASSYTFAEVTWTQTCRTGLVHTWDVCFLRRCAAPLVRQPEVWRQQASFYDPEISRASAE